MIHRKNFDVVILKFLMPLFVNIYANSWLVFNIVASLASIIGGSYSI